MAKANSAKKAPLIFGAMLLLLHGGQAFCAVDNEMPTVVHKYSFLEYTHDFRTKDTGSVGALVKMLEDLHVTPTIEGALDMNEIIAVMGVTKKDVNIFVNSNHVLIHVGGNCLSYDLSVIQKEQPDRFKDIEHAVEEMKRLALGGVPKG